MRKTRDDKASSWRIRAADRWLVGLAQLSTPSVAGRVMIGGGFAAAALIARAALSVIYGELTGFTILLPAVSLAAWRAAGPQPWSRW